MPGVVSLPFVLFGTHCKKNKEEYNMEAYEQVLALLDQPLEFSERAQSELKQAHFTKAQLMDLLKNPKRVEDKEDGFLVHAKKTAKIHLKITEDNTLWVESFTYNPVPCVF